MAARDQVEEAAQSGRHMSAAEIPVDVDVLREEIRKTYTDVSTDTEQDFIFPTGRSWARHSAARSPLCCRDRALPSTPKPDGSEARKPASSGGSGIRWDSGHRTAPAHDDARARIAQNDVEPTLRARCS